MRAYECRDIVILKEFFTKECAVKIARAAASSGASRYFSVDKFRNTTWRKVEEESDGVLKIFKSVEFKDIKIAGGTHMKVSTDYQEYWFVSASDGFKVTNIELV